MKMSKPPLDYDEEVFRKELVRAYSALAEEILNDPEMSDDIPPDKLDELINKHIEGEP